MAKAYRNLYGQILCKNELRTKIGNRFWSEIVKNGCRKVFYNILKTADIKIPISIKIIHKQIFVKNKQKLAKIQK